MKQTLLNDLQKSMLTALMLKISIQRLLKKEAYATQVSPPSQYEEGVLLAVLANAPVDFADERFHCHCKVAVFQSSSIGISRSRRAPTQMCTHVRCDKVVE